MKRSKSAFTTQSRNDTSYNNEGGAEKNHPSLYLYSILCINKDASSDEIKKAYYKQALIYHPDKIATTCPEMDLQQATEKFQQLGLAYQILSSESLRRHYDLTGEYSTEVFTTADEVNWKEYFNSIFSSVTIDAIEKVRLEYQGSKEEKKDLFHFYKLRKGNMDKILNEILFSDSNFPDTQARLIGILKEAISSDVIKSYPIFLDTTTKEACQARVKKHEKNNRKFQRTSLKENKRDHNPLPIKKNHLSEKKLVLPNRKTQTDTFLNQLAKKYSKDTPQDINQDPLSDEQFLDIQEKFKKNK